MPSSLGRDGALELKPPFSATSRNLSFSRTLARGAADPPASVSVCMSWSLRLRKRGNAGAVICRFGEKIGRRFDSDRSSFSSISDSLSLGSSVLPTTVVMPGLGGMSEDLRRGDDGAELDLAIGVVLCSVMGGSGRSRPIDRRQSSELGTTCLGGRIFAAACNRCMLPGRDEFGVSFFSFEFWRLPRRL